MLALNQLSLGFAPSSMPMVQPTAGSISAKMETVDDLKSLSKKLNPILGYFNPMGLGEGAFFDQPGGFWGKGQEATIGWLRQSEIKHGRIASTHPPCGFETKDVLLRHEEGCRYAATLPRSALESSEVCSAPKLFALILFRCSSPRSVCFRWLPGSVGGRSLPVEH